MVAPAGGGEEVPLLATPFQEQGADFAPDGRWIVYASDESGRPEVYVRRFVPPADAGQAPTAGSGKWRISTGVGGMPKWSRDGKEIFYLAPDDNLMAVPVSVTPDFHAGAPRPLFLSRIDLLAGVRDYDVSADGQRFLLNRRVQMDPPPPTIVLDWTAQLKP
jgi:hypothetical protein